VRSINEIIGFALVIISLLAGILFDNSRFNAIDDRLDRMLANLDASIKSIEKKAS
jgi:hypothetical protein